ncbi:hypothetical protein LCGC14_2171240, partial [marine sediment metagenome]
NYITTACQAVGISTPSYYEWLSKGERDFDGGVDSIYAAFFNAIKRAEAQAELNMVDVVREAAVVKREWLPAMTHLSRRHRERWSERYAPTTVQDNRQVHISTVIKHYHSVDQGEEAAERYLSSKE